MSRADLVTKRLGRSSGALYLRVLALQDSAPIAPSTRAAVRLIVIDLLCGSFHDYRSEALIPKGDLVAALRALPDDRAITQVVVDLIADVLRGEFDEEASEGKRWADRMVEGTERFRPLVVVQEKEEPRTITLTPREREVFEWLHRYVEVYGRPPTQRELATGVSIASGRVRSLLDQLEAKGAVRNLGGSRGSVPVRAP